MAIARELELTTPDGEVIAAHYLPPTGPARGAVVIAPAMGVAQAFYAAFADWLASRGFHALTFDFRGTFASRRRPLRQVDIDIVGWAERDASTALRALLERAPGLPVTWIGHSLGGQIVPLLADHGSLAKVVTIACGSGYWRENSPPLRRRAWIVWWLAVPLATPVFGYFPGRLLRMVHDLPRGVIRQWRRWCLDPDYAVGAEGPAMAARFAAVRTPVTSLSFTDDDFMSERNTARLHASYTGAPVALRRFAPADLGVDKIGHFGAFRRAMQGPLWDAIVLGELAAQ